MNVCPPETIGGKFLKKLHKHFMADKVQKFLYFVLQKFLDTVLQKFLGIRDEFNLCPPETIGGKFLKKLHKHLMADKVQKFLYFVLQKFLDTVLQKFLGIRDEFNLCPPETIGGKFLKKLHKHLISRVQSLEISRFLTLEISSLCTIEICRNQR